MSQVPSILSGLGHRMTNSCYCYLQLILRVAIVYSCCSLQATPTLAQTTVSRGIDSRLPGDQRVNSLVTNERSTGYPDLARNFQQPTPQNHAATAWTPPSLQAVANNPLITAGLTSGASTLGGMGRTTPSYAAPTQPKHLKFTLIAGKYWKFNIKSNSLHTSHGEKELRLHGNDSARNFIIDDDGWFQYNHRQQQLFAWPSLSVRPATYYFVLLPSGIDYEADSENGPIDPSDVVADIVVEVIRPYTGSNAPSGKFDIDQLIDYKFSLEYLHRHSSYPLLLSQIVSVFDIFSRTNNIVGPNSLVVQNASSASSTSRATSPQQSATTSSSIAALLQQGKQTRLLANKLNEFLLIDSSATSDGEYFSLTWTSHPSLANNTVDPIHECRLQAINETVSRLSSRSVLYPSSADDKYVIPYSLDGPLANTQSIIPTERGNYALKLSLFNSCRNKRVIEELGVNPTVQGFPTSSIDYRANNIADLSVAETTTASAPDLRQERTTSGTGTSGPIVISAGESTDSLPSELTERTEPGNGVTELKSWSVATDNSRTPATSEPPLIVTTTHQITSSLRPDPPASTIEPVSERGAQESTSETATSSTRLSTSTISTKQFVATPTQFYRPIEPAITQSSATEQAAAGQPTSPAFERTQYAPTQAQTNTRRAIESTVPSSTLASSPSISFKQHQLTNSHLPAGSSFVNSIDSQTDHNPELTMSKVNASVSTDVPVTNASIPAETTSNIIPVITTNSTIASTGNPTPIASKSDQETSLNDDLIGILNEVMEFLVSVAVPLSILLGVILISSILIALCNLYAKRRKSKQFEVGDRFKFRYGSERKMFLKNRSKPVILEADQKSLSMGGTPQHKPLMTPLERDGNVKKKGQNKGSDRSKPHQDLPSRGSNFFDMHLFSGSDGQSDAAGFSSSDCHGDAGGGFSSNHRGD